MHLPRRVKIKSLIEGRYSNNKRPLSWDDRVGGSDVVMTVEGDQLILDSSGDQSSPEPGWEIMLTKPGETSGTFKWTLYGIS